MISITIPGTGEMVFEHLVTDFTGTLSVDGELLPGVREMLNALAQVLRIHVVTADTFVTAHKALEDVECTVTVLSGKDVAALKEAYVRKLGREQVAAVGNGNNDRLMLKAARLGVAVCEGEGCAVSALMNADIHVTGIGDALGLLLNPRRLQATLRS